MLAPGIKTLFLFQGKLHVSTVISVSGDKILLENGLWFEGGLSTRYKNCILVDGSPETIDRVEREQALNSAVYELTFFFADQEWSKRISPGLITEIHTLITEELLNAGGGYT